jgi:predicted RNase H-like nuclease
MSEAYPVAGVDGCPSGWIAVMWRGPGSNAIPVLCRTFADILALKVRVIAIDMPIGLPEVSGREVERQVRLLLGARRSSVFTVPARAAMSAADYRDACRINLAHSDPPRMISKECYHLFKKLREIDAAVTPQMQDRVFEAHPELAFRTMKGMALRHSKRTKEGRRERERLLRKVGFPLAALHTKSYRRVDVAPDDMLDAAALAWVARRIRDGESDRFPARPSHDVRGLRMEINA